MKLMSYGGSSGKETAGASALLMPQTMMARGKLVTDIS